MLHKYVVMFRHVDSNEFLGNGHRVSFLMVKNREPFNSKLVWGLPGASLRLRSVFRCGYWWSKLFLVSGCCNVVGGYGLV